MAASSARPAPLDGVFLRDRLQFFDAPTYRILAHLSKSFAFCHNHYDTAFGITFRLGFLGLNSSLGTKARKFEMRAVWAPSLDENAGFCRRLLTRKKLNRFERRPQKFETCPCRGAKPSLAQNKGRLDSRSPATILKAQLTLSTTHENHENAVRLPPSEPT